MTHAPGGGSSRGASAAQGSLVQRAIGSVPRIIWCCSILAHSVALGAELPAVEHLLEAIESRRATVEQFYAVTGRVAFSPDLADRDRVAVVSASSTICVDRGERIWLAERSLFYAGAPGERRELRLAAIAGDVQQVCAEVTAFGRTDCALREERASNASRQHRGILGLESPAGGPVYSPLVGDLRVLRRDRLLSYPSVVIGAENGELWLSADHDYAPVRMTWTEELPNGRGTQMFERMWLNYALMPTGITGDPEATMPLPTLYVFRRGAPPEQGGPGWRPRGLQLVQVAHCSLNDHVDRVVPDWLVPILPGASVDRFDSLRDDTIGRYGYTPQGLWAVGERRMTDWELPLELTELGPLHRDPGVEPGVAE